MHTEWIHTGYLKHRTRVAVLLAVTALFTPLVALTGLIGT